MAQPALIVVVTVAIVTLGALTFALAVLARELKGLLATLRRMQETLEPSLTALSRDVEVTQRELERVSDAAGRIGSRRIGDGRGTTAG